MPSTVTLHGISSNHLPQPVPYAVLTPGVDGPLPLCILLMGAGGTRESLFDLEPLFNRWWDESVVPRMIVATPTAGLDYYIEDPGGALRWDSFLVSDFLPHLRSTWNAGACVLAGISGGGYGALKLAFKYPHVFAAVAAMQPMLEPGLHESDIGPRNRLHHSAGGPPQLIGPERNAALWELNNPASQARANAQQIRDSGLAIYLEAGDRDFLNAHDGAEFLHRVLWDLDVSHEYHLVRGADHGGPSIHPRLSAMFAWFGSLWNSRMLVERRAPPRGSNPGCRASPHPAPLRRMHLSISCGPGSNRFALRPRAATPPQTESSAGYQRPRCPSAAWRREQHWL